MNKVKKAFTLVEIMATIVIIGVVTVAAYGAYDTTITNAKIDATETDLRAYSQSISSYFADYTEIKIDDTLSVSAYNDKADEIIDLLNRQYLPTDIKRIETASDRTSFTCETTFKKDPWNNKYMVYVNTKAATGLPAGTVIVASCGKDGISSSSTYVAGEFGDDILAIIEPKNVN